MVPSVYLRWLLLICNGCRCYLPSNVFVTVVVIIDVFLVVQSNISYFARIFVWLAMAVHILLNACSSTSRSHLKVCIMLRSQQRQLLKVMMCCGGNDALTTTLGGGKSQPLSTRFTIRSMTNHIVLSQPIPKLATFVLRDGGSLPCAQARMAHLFEALVVRSQNRLW